MKHDTLTVLVADRIHSSLIPRTLWFQTKAFIVVSSISFLLDSILCKEIIKSLMHGGWAEQSSNLTTAHNKYGFTSGSDLIATNYIKMGA